jgi:hypothetical protein
MRFRAVLVTALAVGFTVAPALAGNNPNGIVFRAVGFFKGKASVSQDTITCEVPSIATKISDGAFSIGLWNTFGLPTLLFPDVNSPFGDPCGGYLQVQSNMTTQSIALDRIEVKLSIPGAGRFRSKGVRTFRGWPVACMSLRKSVTYVGDVLGPANSNDVGGSSGAPNVAFVQMLPLLPTETIQCLRSQYAPLPSTSFASLPVVIRVSAVGISDSGSTYRSNTVSYTLNMRHTCGNGRVDDGEECDATSPGNTCAGACTGGVCTNNPNLGCQTNLDCAGACTAPGGPSECICLY